VALPPRAGADVVRATRAWRAAAFHRLFRHKGP
jgi:hypothetical protein